MSFRVNAWLLRSVDTPLLIYLQTGLIRKVSFSLGSGAWGPLPETFIASDSLYQSAYGSSGVPAMVSPPLPNPGLSTCGRGLSRTDV